MFWLCCVHVCGRRGAPQLQYIVAVVCLYSRRSSIVAAIENADLNSGTIPLLRGAFMPRDFGAAIEGVSLLRVPLLETIDCTTTAAFQGGGFSPSPPGSNCLFSSLPLSLSLGLWPCCRKMVFDELAGVVAEPACVQTRSFGEEMSPL